VIEPLENLPAGVIGFRASGTVHASDYRDHLVPAIEAALDKFGKVNVVVVLGDDFDHLSLGATWEDAKLIGLPLSSWGRAALVTNHDVHDGLATAFGGLVPGGFRVFPLAEERAAIDWVAEAAHAT
jgi:stage II sporulation SpoAA-like protein